MRWGVAWLRVGLGPWLGASKGVGLRRRWAGGGARDGHVLLQATDSLLHLVCIVVVVVLVEGARVLIVLRQSVRAS